MAAEKQQERAPADLISAISRSSCLIYDAFSTRSASVQKKLHFRCELKKTSLTGYSSFLKDDLHISPTSPNDSRPTRAREFCY
jgi:hypothetical protein